MPWRAPNGLRGIRATEQLGRTREALALSRHETARLFHVSPPAVAKWEYRGVAERTVDVSRIGQLVDQLRKNLRAYRIPQIVCTLARGLRGRTILDAIRDGGAEPVYSYLVGFELFGGR